MHGAHKQPVMRMSRKGTPAFGVGDWLAIPLRDGGFGTGLVVIVDRSEIILGYFFGPRYATMPSLGMMSEKRPEDAVLVAICGALGIIQGKWKLLGKLPEWSPPAWPIPDFGRVDGISEHGYRVHYGKDLAEPDSERRVSAEEAKGLPEDGLFGAGAVEIRLTELLGRTVGRA